MSNKGLSTKLSGLFPEGVKAVQANSIANGVTMIPENGRLVGDAKLRTALRTGSGARADLRAALTTLN